MKKILNSILITIIFVIPFVTNINIVDAKILKYGDVNEDNFIDGEDVSLVHAFINNAEVPTPIQKTLADINHDGNIDNIDKDLIYQMTMNNSEKLYQKGDVNMNGIVDPIDYNMVKMMVNNNITFSDQQKNLADLSNDGVVSSGDFTYYKDIFNTTNKNMLSVKLVYNNNRSYNISNEEIDFSETSTDNGLFIQKEDITKTKNGYPVIYYRGNVENNYVSFGTYKSDITNVINHSDNTQTNEIVANTNDPILWRIVSINYDGSIKLIAEHNTGLKVAYNNYKLSSKYINDDGSNSIIKTELDNWYNTHISVDKNIDSKIQKSNYCNDITGIDYSKTGNGGKSSVFKRLSENIPTFICPEGAIIDNNKVGSITADEMMYAGSRLEQADVNKKLFIDNNTYFWTISPHSYSYVYAYDTSSNNKSMRSDYSIERSGLAAARPVITLKPNIEVSSGSGTSTDPYIIK